MASKQIGIRTALGATPRDIVGLVVTQAAAMTPALDLRKPEIFAHFKNRLRDGYVKRGMRGFKIDRGEHGEFGRLPISERMDGRDHNNQGFSVWLAGGGVKGGTIVGATDQYGSARSRTRRRSTSCTPRSCTCSASTTRSSPIASTAATCS